MANTYVHHFMVAIEYYNPSETVSETGWYKLEVYNENSCYAAILFLLIL